MAFNPAAVQLKRARTSPDYDPEAAAAAGLGSKGGEVKPTVRAVSALLAAHYSLADLYRDTDSDCFVLGETTGQDAIIELIRELETLTRLTGWYEKRTLVEAAVRLRPRSPHAAWLTGIPANLPSADLTPWTERMKDPAFADEAIRLMMLGYFTRALRPGSKFDYALILLGPQGTGKTTFMDRSFPGKSVAYDADDKFPMETAAECERVVMEEVGDETFSRAKFNMLKDRITATERGENQKFIRGKTQHKVRAVYAGTSNETYLLHSDLQGTRRFLMLIMRRDLTDLMPLMSDEVWRQLISEARRRFDAEEVPVLSAEGEVRQQAALEAVTRPDDDGEVMQQAIDQLLSAEGWFQQGLLQEEIREMDPGLAAGPRFKRAWDELRPLFKHVPLRVSGKPTRVFVPVGVAVSDDDDA